MAEPVFPGYAVVQELGTGGFATVHLATSDSNGEAYAIKQPGLCIEQLSVFLERHADGSPHLHAIILAARTHRWGSVKEYCSRKGHDLHVRWAGS